MNLTDDIYYYYLMKCMKFRDRQGHEKYMILKEYHTLLKRAMFSRKDFKDFIKAYESVYLDEKTEDRFKRRSKRLFNQFVYLKNQKKYFDSKTSKTSQLRFINSLALIFPAKFREEYFGDLQEQVSKMQSDNYSSWSIWSVVAGRSLIAFIILLKVKFQDIIPTHHTPED